MYGVDRRTGREVWSVETEGIVYGPKAVGGGIGMYAEFVADESGEGGAMFMRAMELNTRRVLWTADDSASGPNVVDGVAYYGGTDGTVHGRELYSGDEVFRLGK